MPPDVTASLQLLIAAACAAPERADRLRAVHLEDAAWTTLVADAQRHGLAALLPVVMSARIDVPETVRESAASVLRSNAMQGLRGASDLVNIVTKLQTSGIRLVALKGPAFAQWLYGDVGFRRFSDLDVLIRPDDLTAALGVLEALGYRLAGGMSTKTARAVYGALGAVPLQSDSGYPLDLHWRLAHIRFGAALAADDVLDQSVPIEIAGRVVRMPSPTHAAAFALLHAAKHVWCTLELAYAIARLLQRKDVDWQRVRHDVTAAHAWPGCATGLILANELFEVDLPACLADRPWPAACAQLRAEAFSALHLPHGVFPDRWMERRVHRAAFDRWRDRIRYDVSRVLAPTPLEWQWYPLPDALTSLYSPLRVVRLGVAAVSGAVREGGRRAHLNNSGARS